MKEYLTKNSNGEYQLVNHRFSEDDVEIPHGSNYAYYASQQGKVVFSNIDTSQFYGGALWQREPNYKEFLNSKDGYKLVTLPEYAGDDEKSGLIEVPEGAECLTKCHDEDGKEWLLFWNKNCKWCVGFDDEWVIIQDNLDWYIEAWEGRASIVWQRHTQPEELPFIDDDFIENNFKDWSVEMQDHEFKFSGIRVEQFTDVKKTLNERQSSYGCFEDVARTTCKIMEALVINNPNGLSDLPHPHQEALHMIASKMARIVNGDFNHKDSWHDIQGYAKLIEDLL